MADGRRIAEYWKCYNSPINGPIWTKLGFSSSVGIAMADHLLLLEWRGSAKVWELVKGFLEGISRLLGSGGGRKSVPICHCPWEK